jgi:hypothetical protein
MDTNSLQKTSEILTQSDWYRPDSAEKELEENNGIKKSPYWIATRGIPFIKDIRYTLTPEADRLLCKVSDRTSIMQNFDQMEEAYSCLLGNLCHSYELDEPVIYSRNSNAYIIERQRYGYEFYTYDMINGLTRGMRNQLQELNEMLSSIDLTFRFNYTELSDRAKPRISKLNKLRSMILTNRIQVGGIKHYE